MKVLVRLGTCLFCRVFLVLASRVCPLRTGAYRPGCSTVAVRSRVSRLAGAHLPVPALVPAAAIVALAEGGRMNVEKAREALGRLKPSIRGDVHAAAMEDLETMQRARDGEQ